MDFNPAANALRVVSDTGQNLRQPLATPGAATVADAALSTPPSVAVTPGVTGAAYTNDDLDPATATTLYDLATATDQVVLQSPANVGTLSPTGTTSVDLAGDTGFDIAAEVRDGRAASVAAASSPTSLSCWTSASGSARRPADAPRRAGPTSSSASPRLPAGAH